LFFGDGWHCNGSPSNRGDANVVAIVMGMHSWRCGFVVTDDFVVDVDVDVDDVFVLSLLLVCC